MSKKEILVVDDDTLIRHLFKEAFKSIGYNVDVAESAEAALDILKEKDFEVMFLDLKLPRMSGIDLCRQIRKDNASAVIFAVTGYASKFELSDCLKAGFDDYFAKPVELDVLFKAVEDAFNKIEQREKQA